MDGFSTSMGWKKSGGGVGTAGLGKGDKWRGIRVWPSSEGVMDERVRIRLFC